MNNTMTKDTDVAKRRAERNAVRVTNTDGTQYYKSTRQAFISLGLPLGRHVKFRRELKAMGSHSINGFSFLLISN